MYIERSSTNKYGFSEVVVVHKEQKLHWMTKAYARFQIKVDPFLEINRYLETLPEEVHDEMFTAYQRISNSLAEVVRTSSLLKRVEELYKHINVNKVRDWLIRQNDYNIPHKETDAYSKNPKETTYTEEDHTDLAAFSVAARLMIPIWGKALSMMAGTGVGYPELAAIDIIYRTDLTRCAAFDRLYIYCEAKVEREMTHDEKLNRALTGLASTELPDWVRADAIIKRVVITPILSVDAENAHKTLLSNLHYNTNGNVNPDKRKTPAVDRIRPKQFGNDDGATPGDEDKSSFIENYKMKKKMIEGDIVLANETMSDIREIIANVDNTVPEELIELATLVARRIEFYPVYLHQVKIAQWLLWRWMSPKPLFRLEPTAMRKAIAVSQAILIHWGYVDIAVFMTVEEVVRRTDRSGRNISAKLLLPSRGTTRIDRNEKEMVSEAFPYEIRRSNRNKAKDESSNNFAMRDVELILHEISSKAWLYRGTDELYAQSGQRQGSDQFLAVPSEMKLNLIQLVVKAVK